MKGAGSVENAKLQNTLVWYIVYSLFHFSLVFSLSIFVVTKGVWKELKMTYSESFPERLKNYRKDNGLTQKQLAARWNVSPETISAWEGGRRKPPVQLVLTLTSELEMDKGELIEYISGDSIKSKEGVTQETDSVQLEQNDLIIKKFPNQQWCEPNIRKEARLAKKIKVLTIRGDKYFVGTKSILRDVLEEENSTVELLVLSPEARHITEELAIKLQHKSAEEIRQGMRDSLDHIMRLVRRFKKFQVKSYDEEPIFKILIFDDIMFVSSFAREIPKNDESAEMLMIRGGNALFAGFEKFFDELSRRSFSPG
jgi:transcriptional regulator with XRE-family HTH domain